MIEQRDRDMGHREWAVWALGLLCGLGTAAAEDALVLPLGVALAGVLGLPLAVIVVRRLCLSRRRALVWQDISWHVQR
ncbi:conserved protein of unknown function [Rhodovastum atsumiense]|uniref:Uncharacterized protein n=1 Tax=Rhodovastum atsumiense TaxID=504468 RepID=A0A5M6J3C2_9PROT|nr:hypothetical protein [Rhodovastum atsumiense]KAA5614617.1 hypothetical protein F1189_00360 [Rhodovastum atsumiense]CAH2599874.1 conserved protein of unknown function [Rhodovastum atsumiense]